MADVRILVPLAVLLGLLSFSPVAVASHVQCGDVITQDTTLDSDVICDPAEKPSEAIYGLVIGADDVTLNLGGHRLHYAPGVDFGDVYGIADDGTPRDRLRILNGTVTGFSSSVSLDTSNSVVRGINARTAFGIGLRGNRNIVRHNVLDTGYRAIGLIGDSNSAVHNDVLSYEGEGILARGGNIRIADNFVRTEPMGIFPGILVSDFTNARVTHNDVSTDSSHGIELLNGTGASVARNFAHDNYYFGIVIRSNASNVDLRRNTATANGSADDGYSGIRVESPSTTVTRNTANDNGWYGIEAVPGVIDGGGNRASGNGNPAQCVGVRCR